jgi:hypothetical protein
MFLKSPVAFAQGETWDSATLQIPAPNAFQEKVTCAVFEACTPLQLNQAHVV